MPFNIGFPVLSTKPESEAQVNKRGSLYLKTRECLQNKSKEANKLIIRLQLRTTTNNCFLADSWKCPLALSSLCSPPHPPGREQCTLAAGCNNPRESGLWLHTRLYKQWMWNTASCQHAVPWHARTTCCRRPTTNRNTDRTAVTEQQS